jgi:hypothetical protein
MVVLATDAQRNLKVNIVNGSSGGTAAIDESAFQAGISAGTPAMAESGGELLVLSCDASRNLNVNLQAGSVTVAPTVSSTVTAANIVPVGTSSTLLVAANASAKRRGLQNVGVTKLYILRGTSGASSSNYHFVLPAGGTTADGSSPIYQDTMWQGAYCAASSSAGGECAVEELT